MEWTLPSPDFPLRFLSDIKAPRGGETLIWDPMRVGLQLVPSSIFHILKAGEMSEMDAIYAFQAAGDIVSYK